MGKKWCQYCRINLDYNKKAIEDHQQTRKHQQNKQKHIKFQRIKIQKEQKAKRQQQKKQSFLSSSNIPKAQKGSQLQAEVAQYNHEVVMNGKMAIHQLIAEKTRGLYGAPIQYPEKQDLVLAQNYKQSDKEDESQDQYEMWKIDICQQTGKPCFINRITKNKVYEPPKGYVLSEQQKQEWQQTVKMCEEMQQDKGEDRGIVGDWEQAQEEEDYFQANKAQSSENQKQLNERQKIQFNFVGNVKQVTDVKEQIEVKKQKEKQNWIQELEQKIVKKEIGSEQVFETVMKHKFSVCKNVKQKNDALKNLVKDGFEINSTLNNNVDEMLEQKQIKQEIQTIKPRKKIKKCTIANDIM